MHGSFILASPFYAGFLLSLYRDRVRALVTWTRAHVFTIGKPVVGSDIGQHFYVHPDIPFAKRSLLRALQ